MRVERSGFLDLVVAIAAGAACAKTQPEPAPVVVPVQPPPPVASSPPEPRAAPAPEREADAPIATSDAGASRAPIATYDGPLPRTCASLACPLGAPFHEAFGILKADCRALERNLKKDAFDRFIGCMLAHNNTRETCDLTLMDEERGCLQGWAEPPVVDASTEAKCKPIVARCTKKFDPKHSHAKTVLTMQVCQGLLSVAAPAGERKMISCVTEYCEDGPRLCHIALGH
jgi:hypothetical protein